MRISDLARKLKVKTEELREQLPKFGVPADAAVCPPHKVQDVLDGFKAPAAEDDSGPELMGFMFEADDLAVEEPAPTPAPAQPVPTAASIAEEPLPPVATPAPAPTPAAHVTPAPAPFRPVSSTARPHTPAAPSSTARPHTPVSAAAPASTARPAQPPRPGFVRAQTQDRSAARERWAAAKRASEKLIEQKKRDDAKVAKRAMKDGLQAKTPVAAIRAPVVVIDRNKPKRIIEIGDTISVREFGEKMGVSPIAIVGALFKQGMMTNLNATIDFDTASIVADDFWAEVVRDTAAVSGEDLLKGNIKKLLEDDAKNLSSRPPIVAIMGHVDHGKTTLLDRIRKTNVVDGESGGITQHIGAYQIDLDGRKITFLDTPGHEAFTAMRARGASATDIAILVVAATEGVRPQTLEALNHAKDAGVPIIVALTKVDLPDTQIDRVKGELAEAGLQPSDWGGDIQMLPVSGKTGEGVPELLETILLVHDISPAQANPNRPAVGTVIEAHLNKALGPVATILVNTGTLRVGDHFIIGSVTGKVKRMTAHDGKNITEALPATPVRIAGISELPDRAVGRIFQVFPDSDSARAKAEEFRLLEQAGKTRASSNLSQLMSRINTGELKELKIVLKADAEGSLEALRASIEKVKTDKVYPRIIHAGVGALTETDVLMASAGGGIIFAFHADTPSQVARAAEAEGVIIRSHTIIYKMLEEIEKLMTGLLDPEEVEVELGTLEIMGVFLTETSEQIVGGRVRSGHLISGVKFRVLRAEKEVSEGKILALRREKEVVKEVKEGFDCGLKVSFRGTKIQEGDLLQAYRIEKRKVAV